MIYRLLMIFSLVILPIYADIYHYTCEQWIGANPTTPCDLPPTSYDVTVNDCRIDHYNLITGTSSSCGFDPGPTVGNTDDSSCIYFDYTYEVTIDCTCPDEDIVIPDGKVIQSISLEDTSQSVGCPVLDNNKVNECLALPGGEVVSGISNCCSVYACVAYDNSTCPDNASIDPDNFENCKCNDGYEPSYSLDGTFVCLEKQCPPTVDDLPFFLKVSPADISLCNFFPLSDSSFVSLDPATGCCYGQPNVGDDSICPTDNIEINGQCYPITSSDNNDAPVSHDCPMGEYWSFSANGGEGGCVPFFSDVNGTDPLPSNGGLDGTITDQSGDSSSIDLGYNFDNLDQDQGFADGLVSDVANLDGVSSELNKLLDSYVLIDLPLRATGSCDSELTKTITVLGASYTIDARPWVAMFTGYLPFIRSLVIFSFVFSGVLIVLGRGGE